MFDLDSTSDTCIKTGCRFTLTSYFPSRLLNQKHNYSPSMDVLLFIVLLALSFCLGLMVALAGLAYYVLYFRKLDENSKPDQPSPSKLRASGQFVHFASPLDSTRGTINLFPMGNRSFMSNSATPLGRRLGQQSVELGIKNALAKQQVNLSSLLSSVDLSSVHSGLYLSQHVAGRGGSSGAAPCMSSRRTSTTRDGFSGIRNEPSFPKCSVIEIDD